MDNKMNNLKLNLCLYLKNTSKKTESQWLGLFIITEIVNSGAGRNSRSHADNIHYQWLEPAPCAIGIKERGLILSPVATSLVQRQILKCSWNGKNGQLGNPVALN